jgi:hypothetical protein
MNSAMSSARQGMGNAMSMAKVGHQKVKDSQQIQDGMDMLQQGAERAGNLALAAAGEGAVAAQTPGNRATFGGHFKSERIRWSAHCPVVGLAAETIVVARMCFGTAGSFVTDEIHSPVVLRGVAASRRFGTANCGCGGRGRKQHPRGGGRRGRQLRDTCPRHECCGRGQGVQADPITGRLPAGKSVRYMTQRMPA